MMCVNRKRAEMSTGMIVAMVIAVVLFLVVAFVIAKVTPLGESLNNITLANCRLPDGTPCTQLGKIDENHCPIAKVTGDDALCIGKPKDQYLISENLVLESFYIPGDILYRRQTHNTYVGYCQWQEGNNKCKFVELKDCPEGRIDKDKPCICGDAHKDPVDQRVLGVDFGLCNPDKGRQPSTWHIWSDFSLLPVCYLVTSCSDICARYRMTFFDKNNNKKIDDDEKTLVTGYELEPSPTGAYPCQIPSKIISCKYSYCFTDPNYCTYDAANDVCIETT